MKNKIGFDISGVILRRMPLQVVFAVQRGISDINAIAEHAPSVENVTESIRGIAKKFKPENIFLVSKASDQIAQITMQILKKRNFFKFTGIPESNVHFCRTTEQKVLACKACNVGHFVDSNYTVLTKLSGVSPETHLILFQGDSVSQNKMNQLMFSRYSIVGDGRYLYSAITH
jgi:hypothetical protein